MRSRSLRPANQDPLTSLAKIDVKDWVVWVGAGISFPALPLGLELTEFTLEQTCGKPATEKLLAKWEKTNTALADYNGQQAPLGGAPRLEAILSEVKYIQDSATCMFDFFSGFNSFGAAPFNEKHIFLAQLLHEGAAVVTTNFDNCVQSAFESLYAPDKLELDKSAGFICYRSKISAAPGVLVHAHGTCENLAGMAATIEKVKEGLSPELGRFLDEQFMHEKALIFLGYGAMDAFDINPFFEARLPGAFNRTFACFVQHGKADVPVSAERILQRFGQHCGLKTDTMHFIQALSSIANISTPAAPSVKFEWREEFIRSAKLADVPKVSGLLLVNICLLLGLNNKDIVDSRELRISKKFFPESYFFSRLALANRQRSNTLKEMLSSTKAAMHDERANRRAIWNERVVSFLSAKKLLRLATLFALPLDDIENSAMTSPQLPWHVYTCLSVHCNQLIKKYLKWWSSGSISKHDLKKLNRLVQLTLTLGTRNLNGIAYVNQAAKALRFHFVLEALLNGKTAVNSSARVMYLYSENASADGWAGTYLDLAIQNFFLAKYHKQANKLPAARKYARESITLANIIGDVACGRRARLLLLSFAIFEKFV